MTGMGLDGLINMMIPLMIIYMIGNTIAKTGIFSAFSDLYNTGRIIKERHRNEVKNDGTDRDYAALVRSCKATPTMARWLYTDTTGDRDLISRRWGKIIGLSPRLTFTAILLRTKWYRRSVLILTPNEFLSTVDRPVIQIKARGIMNIAELFYFPIPLRSSDWSGKMDKYWALCYSFIDEVAKERMSIDAQGDMDFQLKSALRNKEEEKYQELINAKMRRSKDPREDLSDEEVY